VAGAEVGGARCLTGWEIAASGAGCRSADCELLLELSDALAELVALGDQVGACDGHASEPGPVGADVEAAAAAASFGEWLPALVADPRDRRAVVIADRREVHARRAGEQPREGSGLLTVDEHTVVSASDCSARRRRVQHRYGVLGHGTEHVAAQVDCDAAAVVVVVCPDERRRRERGRHP
jgi:hypothetical protein